MLINITSFPGFPMMFVNGSAIVTTIIFSVLAQDLVATGVTGVLPEAWVGQPWGESVAAGGSSVTAAPPYQPSNPQLHALLQGFSTPMQLLAPLVVGAYRIWKFTKLAKERAVFMTDSENAKVKLEQLNRALIEDMSVRMRMRRGGGSQQEGAANTMEEFVNAWNENESKTLDSFRRGMNTGTRCAISLFVWLAAAQFCKRGMEPMDLAGAGRFVFRQQDWNNPGGHLAGTSKRFYRRFTSKISPKIEFWAFGERVL